MQSNTVSNANRTINAANNQQVVINSNGATFDIIREIIEVDKTAYKDTLRFAPQLKGYNLKDTCKNIWEFVHNNITYKEDPNGYQFIKTPASLWSTKTGDCKSFAIFVGSILKNLNIPYLYRFVSFDNGNYTHVYIVVPTGQQEIIIDTTIKYFNTETQFKTKKEIPMTKIIAVSGVGADTSRSTPVKISVGDNTLKVAQTLYKSGEDLVKQTALAGGGGTPLNVLLTWKQIDDLQKKSISYINENAIGKFKPFGWVKNLVGSVVTTLNNWSGSLFGLDNGGLGTILLTGFLAVTGTGSIWGLIKIGAAIGFATGPKNKDGIICSLTKYQIALIGENAPDVNNPNYDNYCKLITGLGLQVLAFKVIVSSVGYVASNTNTVATNSNVSVNGFLGDIWDATGGQLLGIDSETIKAGYDVAAGGVDVYNQYANKDGSLKKWKDLTGAEQTTLLQTLLNEYDSIITKGTFAHINDFFASFYYQLGLRINIGNSYSNFWDTSKWAYDRTVAKWYQFNINPTLSLKSSPSTTQSNGTTKKIVLDSSGNLITFNNNANNGNTGTNDLGLPILSVIITYLNTLGKGTFTSNATGNDIIALLKSDGYNVPPTIMTQNDLYNWILANVKKTNNTSSSNTTTYLLIGGGVLAAFLLMGKKGKGRK